MDCNCFRFLCIITTFVPIIKENRFIVRNMLLYPNAKINLGLNIVEKRPDGYHNIETVFYPIGLHDVLSVESAEACIDYSFSTDGIAVGGDPEDNLVVKAYRLMQSECEVPPVDISLVKQIPFGAGLGGGSSDAAFMLKALNELYDLRMTPRRLEKLAAELGADCPVFIRNKPVFATGIGNVFTPIKLSLEGYFLLLVKPDIHVSTPEAYAQVVPRKPAHALPDLLARHVREWRDTVHNDFEESVFSRHPRIAAVKETMYRLGAHYASMSGSGSSVYGLFDTPPTEEAVRVFDGCFISGGWLQ